MAERRKTIFTIIPFPTAPVSHDSSPIGGYIDGNVWANAYFNPEHPILITINMGQALLISMFFQYKILISEPLVLFFYIDLFAGFEKQTKNQYKNQYIKKTIFFQCFHLSPHFPFGPQTLQHQPPPLEGCMHKFHGKVLSFAKDQDPFSRISSITPFFKGCPFSRDALSQGPLATYPFARVLSFCKDQCCIFPFPKGCPKSSRAKVAVPFCKGFPFALRSILSQGLILAISLLQGTSFLKDCLWQTPFFKGHPFSRASLGNCPFARAILLQ